MSPDQRTKNRQCLNRIECRHFALDRRRSNRVLRQLWQHQAGICRNRCAAGSHVCFTAVICTAHVLAALVLCHVHRSHWHGTQHRWREDKQQRDESSQNPPQKDAVGAPEGFAPAFGLTDHVGYLTTGTQRPGKHVFLDSQSRAGAVNSKSPGTYCFCWRNTVRRNRAY